MRGWAITLCALCWALVPLINTSTEAALLFAPWALTSLLCLLFLAEWAVDLVRARKDRRTLVERFRAAVKRSPAAMILDHDWHVTSADPPVLEQRCNHANAVEVTSLAVPGVAQAERVAWWCERCETKLPATWAPPEPPRPDLVQAGRAAAGPIAEAIMAKQRRAAGWSTDPEEVRRGGHEPIEVRTMGERDVWYCPGYRLPPPVDHEAVDRLLTWGWR